MNKYKEQKKRYYQKHKQEILKKVQKYRNTHKKQIKKYQRKYRRTHKSEARKYREKYKEKMLKLSKMNRYKQNRYCIDCSKLITNKAIRCYSCANKLTKLGKNNPAYIDGRSFQNYPSEFNYKLREQIRERNNYICQNCGMTEEEHLIILGEVLHIHHIDYNKNNCEEDNLISLCKQCNLRANKNRNYWYVYYKQILETKIKETNKNG